LEIYPERRSTMNEMEIVETGAEIVETGRRF
jgi:hypothetical protein